jgi:hypothetical protein
MAGSQNQSIYTRFECWILTSTNMVFKAGTAEEWFRNKTCLWPWLIFPDSHLHSVVSLEGRG